MPRFVAFIFSNALQKIYIINHFFDYFIFKDVLDLSVLFYSLFHVTNYSISLN